MQPLGKEMEGVARVPAIGLGERDETVDEEPPRAKLCGLRKEHAVGLQKLLLKDLPRREYDLQSPVTLEFAQVPPEERRVANELIGRHFEQDDHSRLVELAGAAIHELDPECRFSRPGRSRDQDGVPPREAAEKNLVEPVDSCFHHVCFRHKAPLTSMGHLERSRRVQARDDPRMLRIALPEVPGIAAL